MALCIAVAVAAVSTVTAYVNGLKQVTEHLLSVASIKESEVLTWKTSLSANLDAAIGEKAVRQTVRQLLTTDPSQPTFPALQQQFNLHLARVSSEQMAFDQLCLVKTDLTLVACSDFGPAPLPTAYVSALSKAASGQAVVLLPAPDASNGFEAIAIRPISDGNGVSLGFLLGVSAPTKVDRIMGARAGLGTTGQTYLVGEDGTLLTRILGDHFVSGRSSIRTKGAESAMVHKEGGHGVYIGPTGTRVVGVWRWVEPLNAALLAEQNLSEAMGPVQSMAWMNAWLTAVGVLLAYFAAGFLSRRLSTPIRDLAAAAKNLAQGNLDVRAQLAGQTEAQELALSFNLMAGKLKERIDAEVLLAQIARRLLSTTPGQAAVALEATLEKLAAFCGASSAALGILGPDERPAVTYLWPGSDINPAKPHAADWLASLAADPASLNSLVRTGETGPVPGIKGSGSLALTPLYKKGKTWGVLCIASQDPNPWGNEELRLLSLAGEILGMALERGKAEQARAEAEERYRLLIENAADGICQTTPEGRVLLANSSMSKMLGYSSPAELMEKVTNFGRQHWANPLKRAELWSLIANTGEAQGFEDLFLRTDGQLIWVSLNCKAVRDEVGNLVRLDVMVKDITSRKAMEAEREFHLAAMAQKNAELATAQDTITDILDSMPSFLISVAPNGLITRLNAVAAKEAGISRREALGRELDAVFPLLAGRMEDVREAIRSHFPVVHRRQQEQGPDGARYLDIVVYPLGDGSTGAVLRVDDVTDRVRIEEIMVQSEKMLSVGGLAAGMAHEINNPLAGILQSAQNILRRISPNLESNKEAARRTGCDLDSVRAYLDSRGIVEFVEGIKASGERAAKIVANMLEFSRRGDSTLKPRDLADVLDRALELAASDYDLSKNFDFRHIEIVRDYDPQLPPVPCSASQMQQVILNLVRNAAQALHESKDRKDTPRITVRTRKETGFARIEVEDNGPGMPEDIRRRAFEPFYTTKGVGKGTGLGLSVSYFIVTQTHHGAVTVDPAPDGGTLFTIRLPLGGN